MGDKTVDAETHAQGEEPDAMCEEAGDEQSDETTGASPGTAQACDDLGLNSLEANLARFNIKPPGVS